jgi:putative DNA primase/helicase
MKVQVKDAANGRWKSILPALGVDAKYLTNRHGPCPLCEDGKDRFRFDDKAGNGTWFCSKCGAGDGVKLVMLKTGLEFKDAAKAIERLLPGTAKETHADVSDADALRAREAMSRVWGSGGMLTAQTAAGRYLTARLGVLPVCPNLRAAAKLAHFAEGEKTPTYHPALLARLQGPDGKPASIHRTWLTPDGGKASVSPPRMMMRGKIEKGSAIRLAAAGDILGIAEGVETALSAAALFNVPVWAAVSSVGLENWRPPAGVRVVIFGDNDRNFVGQRAANNLAFRLTQEGFEVTTQIPPTAGDDWNDVHVRERQSERAA